MNRDGPWSLHTSLRPDHASMAKLFQNVSSFDETKLTVRSAFANQGPTMKRFRPRAQGRAYRIMKATSHITIVVAA